MVVETSVLVVGDHEHRPREQVGVGAERLVDLGDEPLAAGEVGVAAAWERAETGAVVVFSQVVARNSGNSPVVITDAILEHGVPADVADVVSVRAINPAKHGTELIGAGVWPMGSYAANSRPISGYVVGGSEGVELLFIVRVERPGAWQWSD
jgi:hypothetical protein